MNSCQICKLFGISWIYLNLPGIAQKDAEKFVIYRDKLRIMQFLMALHPDYEPVRASLLHRETFPKLESVVAELLS